VRNTRADADMETLAGAQRRERFEQWRDRIRDVRNGPGGAAAPGMPGMPAANPIGAPRSADDGLGCRRPPACAAAPCFETALIAQGPQALLAGLGYLRSFARRPARLSPNPPVCQPPRRRRPLRFDTVGTCARIEKKLGTAAEPDCHGEEALACGIPSDHPLRAILRPDRARLRGQVGRSRSRLVDYLSLVAGPLHSHGRRPTAAKRRRSHLEQVADMLLEAAALPAGRTCREVHRHIGDFTLSGPASTPIAPTAAFDSPQGHFIDYCEQGKRSYWIASTYANDPYAEEAPVLRRLSEQFGVLFPFLAHLAQSPGTYRSELFAEPPQHRALSSA